FNGLGSGESPPTVVAINLVLLHQPLDTLDQPIRGGTAALECDAVIEFDLTAEFEAEFLGAMLDDMRQFCVVQQRLRGDTAHVEADATPILLFDNRCLESKLRTPDRTDVTARPRAEYYHIIIFSHSGSYHVICKNLATL